MHKAAYTKGQLKFETYYFTTKKEVYNHFKVIGCWLIGGRVANLFRQEGGGGGEEL
jgi:hypothetical protein